MVKTKSVYDAAYPSDGSRLLVSRYWPRGVSKQQLRMSGWKKELAPSRDLLQDWKAGKITWGVYTSRYVQEMHCQSRLIRDLAWGARERDVTLLCFEKEADPHCHRHILKALIDWYLPDEDEDAESDAKSECEDEWDDELWPWEECPGKYHCPFRL